MQTIIYDFRQPYEDLANGIVKQAADDYKKALKTLSQCIRQGYDFKTTNNIAYEIRILNRWFRSSWYETLTGIDSEYLIQHLNKFYGNEDTTNFINKYATYKKERI